jgi:short-subunit dehydrogenase
MFFERTAMSAEEVARIGHQGFRQGRFVVVPGFRNRLMAFGTRLGPRALVRKIAKRFNKVSYE